MSNISNQYPTDFNKRQNFAQGSAASVVEIKIKPEHQLLKMTSNELNSKSRLFGMVLMPSEEVQHESS